MEHTDAPVIFTATHDEPTDLPDPVVRPDGVRFYSSIEYAKVPGYRPLALDLLVPPDPARAPVVVYVHGGGFLFGSRRANSLSAPTFEAALQRGIAVATVDYRLSGEATFPACLHDVNAAIRWLREFAPHLGLREDDIAIWGESAGGHLAALVGMNSADAALVGDIGVTGVDSTVKAAVVWFAPSDLRLLAANGGAADPASGSDADPMALLIGGPLGDNPDAVAFASPVSHIGANTAPMFIAHGENDSVVASIHSVALDEALKAAGRASEVTIVPDADHGFAGVDIGPITERSADFLARVFGGAVQPV